MRVTNNYSVPETITRALRYHNDKYDSGPVDISVTSLLAPVRISTLRRKHRHEMTTDVSESMWALLGSAVHHILEVGAGPNITIEERLYMEIDGWKISGAIDCQEEVEDGWIDITDYKVTSKYSVLEKEPKDEWIEQLNLQAMLVEANKPKRIRNLHICAIVRDWSSSEQKRDPMYPPTPIVMVPIPLWSKQRQLEYARARIAAHRDARLAMEWDIPMAECTPEERWAKGDKFAVFKNENKKATKVLDTEEAADAFIKECKENEKKKKDEYRIQYREGQSVRCAYCGVNEWCDQYARMGAVVEEEEE